MSEAWTMTRPRAGSLIGSFLMANLVIISPIIVWLIGIIASAVFLTSSGDPDALGWFLLLVFVLIIPTLIVMLFLQAKLMFAPICAVLEEIGPIASLKRSWSLVKGELWPTVGRYILMSFIVGFIGGFIGTFIGIIGGVLSLAVTNDPDGTVAVAITTIFVTLGSSLMLPLSASYQTLMYTDLRIRKENFAVVLAQAGAQ